MAELAFKEYIFKKGNKVTVYLYQSSIELVQQGLLGKFNKINLIPYKNIVTITLKKPGFASNGELVIDCGLNNNKKEKQKNTIDFTKHELDQIIELKKTIENKISDIKGQRVDSAIDNFEKLKKLKELYDLDILSEEEYEDQKEMLLER
ncbi:SHOCT domain-containing protein [Metabacillus litoralis]|uniref:SHOCT domain-containing protein n=1 Tax=Metabacillus litoralis TaxID=152268 RepID=A0A5C6WBK9_9BACI|nr:SHOCT domain-containing protein [Metabacillus litoralis]TXC93232.1 SHOCT domain-containing protein [Metabacillus litoralis]